jgi:3-isopropylmalate/(R)-2-methylmalate dehydratase small subunit
MKGGTGNIWCFGDNMNTDVIHPPQYFSLDPEQVKQGLFRGLDPELHKRILPGDIIVGGRNFGCGSSRETSVQSLKLNRVGAIVAIDFARIFFRSATNNGIPCIEFAEPQSMAMVTAAQKVRISFETWTLDTDSGHRIALRPAPPFIVHLWQVGGLVETLARGE